MENPQNKYQRGKVYKITSDAANYVYQGSTIEPYLTNGLSGHRNDYKRQLNEKQRYVASYEIIKHHDAKIILVENFPCASKDKLRAREQHYIENNECINKCKSFTGLSRDDDYNRNCYEQNKDKIKEQQSCYYEKNKDKRNEQ